MLPSCGGYTTAQVHSIESGLRVCIGANPDCNMTRFWQGSALLSG